MQIGTARLLMDNYATAVFVWQGLRMNIAWLLITMANWAWGSFEKLPPVCASWQWLTSVLGVLDSSLELLTELDDEGLDDLAELDVFLLLVGWGVPPLGGTGRGRDCLAGNFG